MANEVCTERFKNIDFMRFIFAVMIVMFHCNSVLYSKFSSAVSHLFHGVTHFNVCVDFFFIISGFFLFKTLKKDLPTFEFIKKRFLRLAPLIWLYLICDTNFNILKIFLVNDIGFAPRTETVIHWYVSALFWVSIFYFVLAKVLQEKYFNLVVWIITASSLGLYLNWSKFALHGNCQNVFYFVNIGVLRGLFGIGIGYFIYLLYKSDFLKNIANGIKKCLSLFELIAFAYFIGIFMFSSVVPQKTAATYLILFSVIFFLFLRQYGFLSKLLNNNFSVVLGSWSYAIYVMHPLILKIFKQFSLSHKAFVTENTLLMFFITVITAIIVGILTHYLFEKPINKLINRSKTQ